MFLPEFIESREPNIKGILFPNLRNLQMHSRSYRHESDLKNVVLVEAGNSFAVIGNRGVRSAWVFHGWGFQQWDIGCKK